MKAISVTPVITKKDLPIEESIKIVDSRKRGKKISIVTRVDDAFVVNMFADKDNIGKFIDMELDPSTNLLTIHFERKDKESK